MAEVAKDLLYTKDHEWVKKDGDVYQIGLADYAQDSLGDIVYVELPDVDDEIDAEDSVASVESVKAASEVYTPFACTVVEANEELDDEPGNINKAPYECWIAKVKFEDFDESKLMNADEYEKFLGEL
ncbi:glycine cleavage system protein GcvH [uncultured Finegoldia sp.]|uniref:glycine cleavage system protein GcvH n=1 Tax=uncultured Finegoldia sp. TaxID=328009 RepID=UPI0026035FF7|nr:glycine cleavage system protein GcvH [uncultured Finegoldia sp.]